MSTPPLVSFVTPFYNAADYLRKCIDSVQRQTYENWEYVLVDNCSRDGSGEIAEASAAADRRIRLFRNESLLSQSRNYNHALRQISAASRYCKMVQADDWIFPECADRMVRVAESDPSVAIVGSYYLNGCQLAGGGLPVETTVMSGRELGRRQLTSNLFVFGSPTTLLYRADVVRGESSFFDEHAVHDDTDVCYRLLQRWKFGFVHQVLSFCRTDNESISSRVRHFDPHTLDKFLMVRKYGPLYLEPPDAEECLRRAEAKYLKRMAASMLRRQGASFWNYHRQGWATIGYQPPKGRLAKYVLAEALDIAFDPKRVAHRLLAGFRNTNAARHGRWPIARMRGA